MVKNSIFILFFFLSFFGFSQQKSSEYRYKKIAVIKDSIYIDSMAINPQKFQIFDKDSVLIKPKAYQVNFSNSLLIINAKKYPTIFVSYFVYPKFITKTYTPFNKSLIVPNTHNTQQLYSLTTNKKPSEVTLFEGLDTKGFIVRGITNGNNQNAVTNAELDLKISGKLSKDVSIRANIYDTNIPLQENGYSQNITDFDRIFIELYSKKWRIKAGDVSLKNNESYFMNFSKQVSGLAIETDVGKNAKVAVSGAIVRGKFANFKFVGIEGNQGPYKIFGPNNEPGIVIVAGSETIYINGVALKKGKNKEYFIDYNLSEISFNTTLPITNDMRIQIDYQYANQNYTRFITYEKASYRSDTFSISGFFYNENDAKNNPLQQNLTETQKQILFEAGDNQDLMVVESAILTPYTENKILYKKVLINNLTVFEYATDESQELYTVTFTNVGAGNGNYNVDKSTAFGAIFKFVGVNQGQYNPVVKLIAPVKSQMFVVKSSYQPNKKTAINSEIALSNYDQNLFSNKDDTNNIGVATLFGWQQLLLDKNWQLKSDMNVKYIKSNFKTIQRFQTIEFFRDWNLQAPKGNQQELEFQLSLQNNNNLFNYKFQFLGFSNNFSGNKHALNSKLSTENTFFTLNSSALKSNSFLQKSTFIRMNSKIEHLFSKSWIGAFVDIETNELKEKITNELHTLSHRFKEYESYFGVGDSTKIFLKIGYNYRQNDSVKNNAFTRVNQRNTVYIKSKVLQSKNSNLNVFASYRVARNTFLDDIKSLNSRINFSQKLFKDFVSFTSTYETSSGNVARQDYVYIKTVPGQGFYTWIDYNNDGVEDLDEFEIAQFQDQAEYLRVPLPNLRYIATQRAKWQQSLTFNFNKWQQKKGLKKLFSHFYNQSFVSINNEQERVKNTFLFNPFNFEKAKLVALYSSFRNKLYFNRNLQHYSAVFSYGLSKNKQQFFIGNQENNLENLQLEFQHKFAKFWLFDFLVNTSKNDLATENFIRRNYKIKEIEIFPKVTFLYHKNHRMSVFYQNKKKNNQLNEYEKLHQQIVGLDYFFNSKKGNQISANINLIDNNFIGNTNTPVAYQLLEGLQAGKNYTWRFLFNRKINSFLRLNINYLGRKSNTSKAIHTGNIQLKAVF